MDAAEGSAQSQYACVGVGDSEKVYELGGTEKRYEIDGVEAVELDGTAVMAEVDGKGTASGTVSTAEKGVDSDVKETTGK